MPTLKVICTETTMHPATSAAVLMEQGGKKQECLTPASGICRFAVNSGSCNVIVKRSGYERGKTINIGNKDIAVYFDNIPADKDVGSVKVRSFLTA